MSKPSVREASDIGQHRGNCTETKLTWVRWAKPRPDCERPLVIGCANCDWVTERRCGSASATRCSPCAETKRRQVARVARSGMVRPGHSYMLTLTCGGSGSHFLPSGERCPCTPPEGVDLASWNASVGKRWNWFVTDLRREPGVELEYFKATEVQRRGALHLHVPMRFRRPCRVSKRRLRELAMRWGFGHEINLVEMRGYVTFVQQHSKTVFH